MAGLGQSQAENSISRVVGLLHIFVSGGLVISGVCRYLLDMTTVMFIDLM
jgi:hypothetical protein